MKAFISYSHPDEGVLQKLRKHLSMLQREKRVTTWYDRDILAGSNIDQEIERRLESCDLFVAIVSPDFLHSNYCFEKEMEMALERHKAGSLVIVPVIVEPCDWQSSPLGQLKAVPKDGRAVSLWPNENEALLNVVTEIRSIVTTFEAKQKTAPVAASSRATAVVGSQPSMPQPLRSTLDQPKYKVKKVFDSIDRADFRTETFALIRNYFEKSCKEMDGVNGLRTRHQSMSATAFTCTIVNTQMKGARNGTAYITVREGESSFLGDISWSFAQHAASNTANGGFSIEADEFHLFLRGNIFSGGDERRKWYPDEAASYLWQTFIHQVGVSI